MELTSPIVYKKIDLQKFDKSGMSYLNPAVFFDGISKNIVQITEDNIKIFNKSATNMKKNLNIKLQKDKVNKVSVDKFIRYMLVLIENKMILVINLQTEKVCDILHYDFTSLLGLFFVNSCHAPKPNEDVKFCIILQNKVVYFKISNTNQSETLSEVKNIKICSIVNWHYNLLFMVLCIEKGDKTFDLINLSSEKFYGKNHFFKLPKKESNGFFSFFKRTNSNQGTSVSNTRRNKDDMYRQTQFFLQTVYNKLYLICLNYEESEIQFYHIENLSQIKKSRTLSFDNTHISTLQFIDNLILLHNFEKCETSLYDLKADSNDKIIFKSFPMTSYEILRQNQQILTDLIAVEAKENVEDEDNIVDVKIKYNQVEPVSMLSYNNRIFYEKNIFVQDTLIVEGNDGNSNDLYYIYFDSMIYYDNTYLKHEVVFNLIRRKNSKDVIIRCVFEMIRDKCSIKIIKIIFDRIVRQLQKSLYNKTIVNLHHRSSVVQGNLRGLSTQEEDRRYSNILMETKDIIFHRKKTIVKQPDVYYGLFKPFEQNDNADVEYLIKLLLHFANCLSAHNVPLQPSFNTVLLVFLRKLGNNSLLNILLQYHLIPDSTELAKFLTDEVHHILPNIHKQSALQLGLDMFIRLKRYNEAFIALLSHNKVNEAFMLYNKYPSISIETLTPSHIEHLKELIKSNKQIFNLFIYGK